MIETTFHMWYEGYDRAASNEVYRQQAYNVGSVASDV